MAKTDIAKMEDPQERRLSLLDAIRTGDLTAVKNVDFHELARVATLPADQLPPGEPVPVTASQRGDGFVLMTKAQKEQLVGVPFIILAIDMNPSRVSPGGYFSTLRIKTARPLDSIRPGCDTFILNDGSSGIHGELYQQRVDGQERLPILCERGLRYSEYDITTDEVDAQGQPVLDPITRKPRQVPAVNPLTGEPLGKGRTYYLDHSA